MKKSYAYFFLFLLLMLLFTAGCANVSGESSEKINSPRNSLIPVAGTWEVTGLIENGALRLEELPEPWPGKSFQFSEDYALLGDNILEKPRYKIKRVNKEEYLLYGHKFLPKELDTTDKELDVITVTDKDKFLCEIIRVSSKALILEIDNCRLYLKKISDQVSRRADLKYQENTGDVHLEADSSKETPKTGVFVGFCSPAPGSGKKADKAYNYRTFWIAATDKQLHPILNTQGILFPRISGFWRMEAKRSVGKGYTEDFIIAHPVAAGEKKEAKTDVPVEPVEGEERAGSITRCVRYVGNDYVSIESKDADTAENTLQVLPIDSLPSIKTVKIADLSGEAGAAAMEEGKRKAIEELEANGGSLAGDIGQNDSFGLERKMGHWFFKGRINYRKDDKTRFADYSINVIPPAEMIFYDELSVPWTAVKDRIPEAVDVFTSPNRDIALVITRTELVVFGITSGRLENQPLGRISLKTGETVVMAEWAVGRYVEAWENSFIDEQTLEFTDSITSPK